MRIQHFEVRVMVLNATFNNISAISWWLVLLVEENRVQDKTTDLSPDTDKLYHIMLYRVHLTMNTLLQWNDKKGLSEWVSEWLLLSANSAIFHLYHGENTLIFNEMIVYNYCYLINDTKRIRHTFCQLMESSPIYTIIITLYWEWTRKQETYNFII